jgi:hypothetical protein
VKQASKARARIGSQRATDLAKASPSRSVEQGVDVSIRETFRRCGIKPSRRMRDWIKRERARRRRELTLIAGSATRRNWRKYLWGSWGRGLYDDAVYYGVNIPRSLRSDFAQWQRVNEEAKREVFDELMKELPAS